MLYREWSFQSDEVGLDAVDCFVGYNRLAVLQLRRDVHRFPSDGRLCLSVSVLYGC